MKFMSLNDKRIKRIEDINPIIQLGLVDLEIVEAKETKTFADKKKIDLRLIATDDLGITVIVFDCLLLPENYGGKGKALVFNKLKFFCESFNVNCELGNNHRIINWKKRRRMYR